jgi:hypothetical protein
MIPPKVARFLCGVMEPEPFGTGGGSFSLQLWWKRSLRWKTLIPEDVWEPRELDLDRLREIEGKLTEEQAKNYDELLADASQDFTLPYAWRASAYEKAMALYEALKGVLDGRST